MVAVDVFGHFVRQEKHLDVLAKLPTLIVQTEIDDSADHTVGMQVIKEIEDRTGNYSHSLDYHIFPLSICFFHRKTISLFIVCTNASRDMPTTIIPFL